MRHRLSLFTTIFTFIALMLGNLVTATGAKDACGTDWPLCSGQYFPNLHDPLQIIEYSHRLFTVSLGFVILINGILAIRRRKPNEKGVLFFALSSLVLLLAQSGIGAINVMLGTPPGLTTLDVVVALLLLMSLILLTVTLQRKPIKDLTVDIKETQEQYFRFYKPALFTVVALYIEIGIGAFFKHSAASQVLLGVELETYERLVHSVQLADFIYFVHGITTFVVIFGALWTLFLAFKEGILYKTAILLIVLLSIEAFSGIMAYVTQLKPLSSSAHMLLASASLGIATYIMAKARFGKYLIIK